MALTLTRLIATACLAVALLPTVVPRANAQDAEARTVTVLTRERPELDALGIRLGAFTLFSGLELQETYNDNIFAVGGSDPANPMESDFITLISPDLRIQSNWSRHRLALFGGVDYGIHASNGSENFFDWRLGGEGRLDVRRDTHISGGLEFLKRHEGRASVNDPRGVDPVDYYLIKPRGGYLRRWNRVSLKIDGALDYYSFTDGVNAAGAAIDNGGRDRFEYSATARLGYELLESYEAFVTARYGINDYVLALDPRFFVNRDSSYYGYSGGIRVGLTGLMFGDFYGAGVSHRYDDASLPDITEYSYGVRLTWNMSRLTTLEFAAEQAVNETTVYGASASLDTIYRGSLDHELLRNVIVSINVNQTRSEYPGEATGRIDNLLNIGALGKYMLNRNLYITLGYDRAERDSTVGQADFAANVYMVRLRIQK